MREKSWVVTEDKANALVPYLKWASKNVPREKYRLASRSLLGKLRGIKDWKQILITGAEADIVQAIYGAFPESYSMQEEQLRLFE